MLVMDQAGHMKTKDKILEVSLELFSQRGVSTVSVRDIAAAVGVRESALYRHFPSKQAVFDELLENYLKQSKAFMSSIRAQPTKDPYEMAQTAGFYGQLTDEDFLRIGGSVFTEFLMQPDVLRFWRIMSIERMNDKSLAAMWKQHLFEEPIAFQTELFRMLIHSGEIKMADPEIMALEFFSPLLLLYLHALPFGPGSPETTYFLDFANRHMIHFRTVYSTKEAQTG